MSHQVINQIRCDVQTCPVTFRMALGERVDAARTRAQAQGWISTVRHRARYDFCPTHVTQALESKAVRVR